jgi:hypothetical protein
MVRAFNALCKGAEIPGIQNGYGFSGLLEELLSTLLRPLLLHLLSTVHYRFLVLSPQYGVSFNPIKNSR